MQVVFILNTTGLLFAKWLEEQTKTIHTRDFPAKGALKQPDHVHEEEEQTKTIHIGDLPRRWAAQGIRSPSIPITEPVTVGVEAMLLERVDENTERVLTPVIPGWQHFVIAFRIVPISPERIEVTASCNHPDFAAYFAELLVAIAQRWPESGLGAEQPDARLEGAHETAPVKKSARRGAPRLEMRLDAERKKETALKYLKLRNSGTPAEIAADLCGYSRKTLNAWVRRFGLDKHEENTNKGQ